MVSLGAPHIFASQAFVESLVSSHLMPPSLEAYMRSWGSGLMDRFGGPWEFALKGATTCNASRLI